MVIDDHLYYAGLLVADDLLQEMSASIEKSEPIMMNARLGDNSLVRVQVLHQACLPNFYLCRVQTTGQHLLINNLKFEKEKPVDNVK